MPPADSWPISPVKPSDPPEVYLTITPKRIKHIQMKKLIPFMLLVAGISGTTLAQKNPDRRQGPPPPPRQEQGKKGPMARIPWKELDLTDGQREAFRKQRETFKQKMEALKKEENITVKEWKSRMEKLRKDNQSAMQNILTADQKAKMKRLREEQEVRMMQGLKKRLELTDEQMGQLKNQRSNTQQQMKAIRENNSLSADEKKEAMKKLMRAQKDNLEKILTPEQRVKMKDRMQNRPGQGPQPGMRRRPGMNPPPEGERPPRQTL